MDAELASEIACVLMRERERGGGWKNWNVSLIALNFKNHYFTLKNYVSQNRTRYLQFHALRNLI